MACAAIHVSTLLLVVSGGWSKTEIIAFEIYNVSLLLSWLLLLCLSTYRGTVLLSPDFALSIVGSHLIFTQASLGRHFCNYFIDEVTMKVLSQNLNHALYETEVWNVSTVPHFLM